MNTLLTEPSGGGTDVQNLTLTYDEVGNLKTRDDAVIGIGEDFSYDSLSRLTSATVDYQSPTTASYSAAGDINSKSECGTYTYGSRPHLVTGTTSCGSMSYDANSRMITRGSGEIDWYSYDLPSKIDDPADTVYSQFWYGPDRSRIKQYQSDTGATITYVGELFEYEDTSSTDTARYYVHAGSRVVAMVERVGSTNTTQYLHRDQQNSITKITSSGGSVTQSLAYDAWGLRRNASTWAPLGSPFAGSHETERGYTGHEHLDNVGLIHMNGRVQDPRLGRFISADPFIQAPYLTQSHNRFAYVMNNPATLVDPSGFQWTLGDLSLGVFHDHGWHMSQVNSNQNPRPPLALPDALTMDNLDYTRAAEALERRAHELVWDDFLAEGRQSFAQFEHPESRYATVPSLMFPNIAAWGERGERGTFGSNAWGFLKAASNFGGAIGAGPNIQLPIFNRELTGAAFFDGATVVVGPLVRGGMLLSRGGAFARSTFGAPTIFRTTRGLLSNGRYVLDEAGMAPHLTGSLAGGRSQFLFRVDARRAVLDAAAFADEAGLWVGNKAKVLVTNGPVGVSGQTGELTQWINVYRTRTGFVHGAPGGAP